MLTNSMLTWREQSGRPRLNQAGDLAMTIDASHSGDSIIRCDNLSVRSVHGRLATSGWHAQPPISEANATG